MTSKISDPSTYSPTIGLEVHIELKTKTKMFCDSLNDPAERHPNQNVCPICLGHPGVLPTINKKAVEAVLKVGMALGGKVALKTKFDRKNYFYPDLPKGYQVSQYDEPLISGGELNGARIRRVHLEEDTGRLMHTTDSKTKKEISLVDFNRSGAPLMELVTEPDFKTPEAVVSFAEELQLIMRYLGLSDADMEKGEMRIEANVSLNMGTKVELKNINSYKAVFEAINYEVERQKERLAKGEKIIQETRGWNPEKRITFSQRFKEEAHDYRYFPEPDLPSFETKIFNPDLLKDSLPELPDAKRARFSKEYGLNKDQVKILASNLNLANYFESAASEYGERSEGEKELNYELLYNYLASDLTGLMNEEKAGFSVLNEKVEPEHFAHLIFLIKKGKITSRLAKDILRKMFDTNLDPEEIIQNEKISLSSDQELKEAILEIIEEEKKAIEDLKKGKASAMQFLIGKTMQKLKGRGEPQKIRLILDEVLTKMQK